MKTAVYETKKQQPVTCLRLALVPVLAAALAAGAATVRADQAALVGVWKFAVYRADCDTWEADFEGVPSNTLNAFYADGNVQELAFGLDTGFSRTMGLGTWAKSGKRTFAVYSQMGLRDDAGKNFGYIELERMMTVARDRQTLEAHGKGSLYLNDGQFLVEVCALSLGERLPDPNPF